MIETVTVKLKQGNYDATLTLRPEYEKKYEVVIEKKGELVFYGVGATAAEVQKQFDNEIMLLIELSGQISKAMKILEPFENKEKEG